MHIIKFKKKAEKELRKLPTASIKKIVPEIDKLQDEPRPQGSKKLKGAEEEIWRIRIGDYRVIYLIDDDIKIIEIRKIGHRKDVYKV